MLDRAGHRRAKFFEGTARDPEVNAVPDTLETQALTTIEINLRARADAEGRPLDTAQTKQALAVAQRLLRQLPREQLQSIAASGGLLQSITAQSLAGTTVTADKADPRSHPDGSGAPARDGSANLLRFGDATLRAASGARFSEIGGNLNSELARTIEIARHDAVRLGIPWAANNLELLRLGPAAIKAIAETNLRETGYKALRNGAYYEAPDVVAFAKHSKLRGFDAEKAAKSTEALVQSLPPDERKGVADILKGYDHAAAAHYANPADAAARERFETAGRAHKQKMEDIAKRSQDDYARVQRLEDDKRLEQRFRATTIGNEHSATIKERRAESKEQKADATSEDLVAIAGGAPAAPKSGDAPKASEAKPDKTVAAPAKPAPPKP